MSQVMPLSARSSKKLQMLKYQLNLESVPVTAAGSFLMSLTAAATDRAGPEPGSSVMFSCNKSS